MQDCLESMSYRDHSGKLKVFADSFLDEFVGVSIHCGRGFVEHHDLCAPEESSGQGHQLTFADRNILAA